MTWTHDDPTQGSPAAIQGLANLRSARAGKIRDAQRSLQAAASGSGAEWKAMSQTAFASKLSKDAADIELLATGLEAQAAALQTYAGQLSQLKDRQRALEQQRSSADYDLGLAKLKLSSISSEIPTLLRADTPDPDATAAAKRRSAAATAAVDDAQARSRAIDAQWDQLACDRRSIDATCTSALQSGSVLGNLSGVASSTTSRLSGNELLALLVGLSATDRRILFQQYPDLASKLASASPGSVAAWWSAIGADDGRDFSEAQAWYIGKMPSLLGSLNGLPAAARVAANEINAKKRLKQAAAELFDWREQARKAGRADMFEDQVRLLQSEIKYLKRATSSPPTIQLYLYDQKKDRIIEMLGNPGPQTRNIVTYVPGTFADLNGFYSGETQAVASYLTKAGNGDTVAFVYKDGTFPTTVLVQANDQEFARQAGKILAEFEAGVHAQPNLSSAQQVAIGHSWGTANVTSSELAGARYKQVISLSGAGMQLDWSPRHGTKYTDLSYDDILQFAQRLPGDQVWNGLNPRADAFDHGPYYPGPDGSNPLSRHNLVASDDPNNQKVLDDLDALVKSGQR